jgi:hypothetical protein
MGFLAILPACASMPTASQGTASPSSRTTESATPAATATSTPQVRITGFGATDADWNRAHTPDPDFASDSVYDPDPTLPTINGHTGAKYVTVTHQNGRVTVYTLNLHPRTTIDQAKGIALQEFPPDTHILWFTVKDACAEMEVQSAILAAALGAPPLGDPQGQAYVELDSALPDGTATYNATNINEAILVLASYPTVADAAPC